VTARRRRRRPRRGHVHPQDAAGRPVILLSSCLALKPAAKARRPRRWRRKRGLLSAGSTPGRGAPRFAVLEHEALAGVIVGHVMRTSRPNPVDQAPGAAVVGARYRPVIPRRSRCGRADEDEVRDHPAHVNMRQEPPASLLMYARSCHTRASTVRGSCGLTVGRNCAPPPPGPITLQRHWPQR